ncbi:MAG: ADP-ribosylglycohydrolase family protein [Gemmatimonadota bacterium]|jgi:ADP-ribosyl-[dinitrogen reductase] hydrolase
MRTRDRFLGCLLGLAAGDAVGTTVEFRPRGRFEPLTDMVGGGPFRLQAGQWTDDTSMALCLAESLLEAGGFDPRDQMQRYLLWWAEGHLSSTGRCFDIGNTVSSALANFMGTGDPYSGSTHPYSAGNGSIMRLAPVPMFFFGDEKVAVLRTAESSRTTHGTEECLDACRLFGLHLHRALAGKTKEEILAPPVSIPGGPLVPKIQSIAEGSYAGKPEAEIRGTGYVVESLEAALWCFQRTTTFEQAVLAAANLGDDADTTAAVTGQIAGAFYGMEGIPERWLEKLAMREVIEGLAMALWRGHEGLSG